MDKQQAAISIIDHSLPHVVFDGWIMPALMQGAVEAGYKKTDVIRVFPNGAIDAVMAYLHMADGKMAHNLAGYNLSSMKLRERITLAVRLRLEAYQPHKEAARRAHQLLAFPLYLHRKAASCYATVDRIWYEVGDKSTDFNFYTKRATLALVYGSTLLYWLNDTTANHEESWQFLDRRIENVMQFEKFKHTLRSQFA